MELFVIRHGIAEERREGLDDTTRKLTKEGRERFAAAVKGLARLEVGFDRLYTSPWTRAVQTAELLEPLLEGERVVTEQLAKAPSEALLDELRGERTAVVGHEPWLGELVAMLVTGDASLGERFPLKKGGVAWLEGEPEPGQMVLRAVLMPKVLRGLR